MKAGPDLGLNGLKMNVGCATSICCEIRCCFLACLKSLFTPYNAVVAINADVYVQPCPFANAAMDSSISIRLPPSLRRPLPRSRRYVPGQSRFTTANAVSHLVAYVRSLRKNAAVTNVLWVRDECD